MALSADRNTQKMSPNTIPVIPSYPVKGLTKIYAGSQVALNAGYLVPASAALGLIAVGRAMERVDNSAGSDGDLKCRVEPGAFYWENSSAGDAIAQADVGNVCYLVDDQTVAKTDGSGARSPAGTILAVDSGGVCVLAMPPVQSTTAPTQGNSVIAIPLPALANIADAQVVARFTPGFAGKIKKVQVQATVAVSTGSKATTLTPKIAGTSVTGGVAALTSANLNAVGANVAGTAVTALNTFTAGQEITVVASSTTAFVEGAAVLLITIG